MAGSTSPKGWEPPRGRSRRGLALAALALGLLGGAVSAEEGKPPAAGDPAKAAPSTASLYGTTLKNLQDQPQTLEAYKGKVTVVYFWATWCAPCLIETPKLVKLYERFKDKDVVVIGIALDNADKVRAFTKKMNVNYPVLYGGTTAIQIGRDLGNDVGAVPFTVILDKSGRVVETIKGDTPDGKLESILEPLVG